MIYGTGLATGGPLGLPAATVLSYQIALGCIRVSVGESGGAIALPGASAVFLLPRHASRSESRA